jgi:hypothetical protein
MKKIFTLFAMTMMLAFSSQAAYYIVGNDPFGNWDPGNGVQMNDNGDGTYSYTATISGSVWFVFASGLDSSWDVFNTNYRFGPSGNDVEVGVGQWYDTPQGGDKSYKFTGSGSAYVFTFNPFIKKFKIEGDVIPVEINTYTVAGTPAAVFGTEWDPSNAENDMIKQNDGTYALTKYNCELAGNELAFKVVGNRDWGNAWPNDNVVVEVDGPGLYDVTFTFNPDGNQVAYSYEKSGSFDPRTGKLFILGEVNGNGWDPSKGVEMETEDENIFTAQITTAGENPDENDGIGYSYFSFTTKLGENIDDWSSIGGYRIGSVEDGFPLTEDMYGIDIEMGNFGQGYSFKVPAGTYNVTVNLENRIMMIEKAGEEPPVEEGYKIKKVWEITDMPSLLTTNDARQGFGMNGKFYINNKADQKVVVIDENGIANIEYPGGANCGITRDEAGNIVVSNAAFPGGWVEATIKVINPVTNEVKEYTVPEECGLLGRCDFIGFAKGNLMEDGVLYMTGGNTNNANGDPFTDGVAIMTIAGGEVNVDECYTAACDGLVGQTSTVINYFKNLNEEDVLIYAYRSGNPSKLMFDGDNLVATPIMLPGKGHANGIFPFIWEGKEYYIYPTMPDYQNGFAIAEDGAEEPIVEVTSTVNGNANAFQADWFNAEVDEKGVNIYQYYPGGHVTVYRLTNNTGDVEELFNDTNKVVAGVRYYNIMGQEMKEANGITIVVTTYTDGSHSAVKVIK